MTGDDEERSVLRVEAGDVVGVCPDCGLVTGDDVTYRFPHSGECNRCGETLVSETVATETTEVATDKMERVSSGD